MRLKTPLKTLNGVILNNHYPYIAGWCLPFPFGCRIHDKAVNELIEPALVPQNLQVYFDFSLPS